MADRNRRKGVPPDASAETASPTETAVVAYLTAHPDFLTEHVELLPFLTPPQRRQGSNVVDMQLFMLQRLQDEVARLKVQQRALISTSRTNLMSQQRIHAASLEIIGARTFELLVQTITTDLSVLLDIDVTTLCVEFEQGRKPKTAGIQLLPNGAVDELLGAGRDALLEDHVRGDPMIFGDGAGLVKSEALLRLSIPKGPAGILALGSRKPTKFRPGHGVELLCFLARTVSVTIAQWLDL